MISGKIEALSIVKILRSIMTRKMTGTLRLEDQEIEKRFVFFKGSVRLSYSSLPSEHLATRLRDLGLISSIEMGSLRKSDAYRTEKFTDEILASGLVAERRLSRIEASLARERLLQLFEWSNGSYAFTEDANTSQLPVFEIDMTALIVEATFIRTSFTTCENFVMNLQGSQILKCSGAPSESIKQALQETWVYTQSLEGVTLNEVLADPENRHSNVRAAAAMILSGVGQLQKADRSATATNNSTASKPPPASAVIGSRPYQMKSERDDSKADSGRRVVLKSQRSVQE